MFKHLPCKTFCFLLLGLLFVSKLWARDAIQIVGSSTVYAFSAQVAEHHGWQQTFKSPVVESIGTGGGLKRFCAGVGYSFPDVANASRPIKADELAVCKRNGVNQVSEFTFGYDGIVVANSREAEPLALSPRDLYLAMAKYVPSDDGSHTVVENPYSHWRDINSALPNTPIVIYGPPSSSGTQEALRSLVLKSECRKVAWLKALAVVNSERFNALCTHIREDGRYLSVGENDNISVQRVMQIHSAVGVFGYGVFQQYQAELQAAHINGYLPTAESIAVGRYPLARPLYFYVKSQHLHIVPGLADFVARFLSDEMIGEQGLLANEGLVPAQPQIRILQRNKLSLMLATAVGKGGVDAS